MFRYRLLILAPLVMIASALVIWPIQAQGCTYTVQAGDSVARIAQMVDLQAWELQEMNGETYPAIWNNVVQPGWVLTIPCDGGATPPPNNDAPADVQGTPWNNLNIRAGPGTTYDILGQVTAGEPLPLTGRTSGGDWVYFEHNGQQGWLAAWLMTVNGDLYSLPVRPTTPAPPAPPPPPQGAPVGYTGHYAYIGPHLRSIYERGQTLGRNTYRFSKVGDSETWNQHYLQPFTSPHDLGPYAYLDEIVTLYFNSMSHLGQAAVVGLPATSMVDPLWADPALCTPDETPLACEYRRYDPAIALIMVRTWKDDAGYNEAYGQALQEIVGYSIAQGVIPVLSTLPHHPEPWPPEEPMNATIRQVARAYNVPLWDLSRTTDGLPGQGVDDSRHLTLPPDLMSANMTESYMEYGKNRRNLEALEVLHQILYEVIRQ